MAGAVVGNDMAVFVGCAGGSVGVLKGVAAANCAWTVNAACVNTAFGSSVCCALEGRLHAERISASKMLKVDIMRAILDMVILLGLINQFYMIEDVLPSPFVPVKKKRSRQGVTVAVHIQASGWFVYPGHP
jgi:hypothetical protein